MLGTRKKSIKRVLTGKRGALEKMGFEIVKYKFCCLVWEGGNIGRGRSDGVSCGEIIIIEREEGGSGGVEG